MQKFFLLIALVCMISCKQTIVTGFQDKPVVESYLYADDSPTVKVSKLIPFTSDMTLSDMDVTKLDIRITETSSGTKYAMASNGDGTYQNSSLIIGAGKTYELSFPYNGMNITATTVVPDKPQNLTLSATTLAIAASGSGGDMPSPITLKWTNTDQSYYLIYVKNVESNKIAIDAKDTRAQDFFRNTPTTSNTYELNPRSFKYYGMHRVILYKIRPEYVLFFQQNSTNSLSISEIKANVENGFGIFTAVNSVSAYLYVGKP